MKTILSVCLLVLCLVGCKREADTPVTVESLGKILDSTVVPTSFNEAQRTQIKTEKMVVIVRGYPAVRIGVEAKSIQWKSGQRTIEWEGSIYAYQY